jgi:hypothetical protein
VRLPRTIRLASQTVRVERASHIQLGEEHEHAQAWGLYDGAQPLILVASGQGHDRERNTFLHENLHLLWDIAGIGDEYEEDIVNRLAPLLLCWLRENPRAVAYLTEKEAK